MKIFGKKFGVNAPMIAHSIIAAKGGVAKSNRYRVVLPTMFIGGDVITMDVMCRAVDIPGRIITSQERRTGMRITEIPNGNTNDDITMTFTETMDQTISRYFEKWGDQIVSPNTHELRFKDEIVRDIMIMPTDDAGIPTRIYKIRNAWPKIKPGVPLSDSSDASAVEITITWAYDDFEVIASNLVGAARDLSRIVKSGHLVFPTNIISNLPGIGTF